MSLKEQSQDTVKQEIPRLIHRYCERLSYGIIIITEKALFISIGENVTQIPFSLSIFYKIKQSHA